MVIRPYPAAMAVIVWAKQAHSPVTLVGIADRIGYCAHAIDQLDHFATVTQSPLPASDDIGDSGVRGLECVQVRSHCEVLPRAKCYVRKCKIHGIGEPPI